jgi:hypothetical protein
MDFYARLGFSETAVGEAWNHPYAVMTDGRVCLGLHQRSDFPNSLTFVKPDLRANLVQFENMGFEFEIRRLGDEVFNEVGWYDPSGHLIRLVEARTFSPSKRKPLDSSACGYFVALGLPASNAGAAKTFWERIGFVGMEEPTASLPHVACTSDTIDIGLYLPAHLPEPTLLFEIEDLEKSSAELSARGVTFDRRVPDRMKASAILLHAPEGTPILIQASSGRL